MREDTTAGNNYGVVAKESPGLRFVCVSNRVGGAPDDERGGNGSDGTDGLDGTDAGSAIWEQLEVDQAQDRAYNGVFPGKGGENVDCPEANGGDGGYGACGSFVWNADFLGAGGRIDSPNGEPGHEANSASPNGINGGSSGS